MQISAIGQNNYKNAFGNRYQDQRNGTEAAYRKTLAFATLPDNNLRRIAQIDASKDDKYKAGTLATMLLAIPATDIFTSSALADSKFGIIQSKVKKGQVISKIFADAGKTSKKLAKFASRTGYWTAGIGGAVAYNMALNKIEKVFPAVRKFGDNHPVLDTLLNLTGFGLLIIGATKLWDKANTYITTKMPNTTKEIAQKVKKLGEKIDASTINNKIFKPLGNKMEKIVVKHPEVAIGIMAVKNLVVPALIFGTLFKIITDRNEKKAKIEDSYKKLLAGRQICRNKIDDVVNERIQEEAATEAKIIAQNEIIAAKKEALLEKSQEAGETAVAETVQEASETDED